VFSGLLALPALAMEKTWFCSMTSFHETTKTGPMGYEEQKFKIQVNKDIVSFGTGGWFNSKSFTTTMFSDLDLWKAGRGDTESIAFKDGFLLYSLNDFGRGVQISALCDAF
jgi:hypothetical protein